MGVILLLCIVLLRVRVSCPLRRHRLGRLRVPWLRCRSRVSGLLCRLRVPRLLHRLPILRVS